MKTQKNELSRLISTIYFCASNQMNVSNHRIVRLFSSLAFGAILFLGLPTKSSADLLDCAYIEDIYDIGFQAEGATWDGSQLWIADSLASTTNLIRRFDTSGGNFSLTGSIPMPVNSMRGLAWDGSYLWSSTGDSYLKIDPATGNLEGSITSSGTGSFGGVTYDGQYLWKASRPEYNQIDLANGNIVDTIFGIDLPGTEEGITWTGTDLLVIAQGFSQTDGMIHRIDGTTHTLQSDSFLLPRGAYNGLAYDGEYLWAVDWQGSQVIKIGFTSVPEPNMATPMILGLIGICARRRRR